MINNMYDTLADNIIEEYHIEVQDKYQLLEDGVNIEKIYIDDFYCLRKILYTDVNFYTKRGKLTATQVSDLLNLIDYLFDESVEAVRTVIKHRKEVIHI